MTIIEFALFAYDRQHVFYIQGTRLHFHTKTGSGHSDECSFSFVISLASLTSMTSTAGSTSIALAVATLHGVSVGGGAAVFSDNSCRCNAVCGVLGFGNLSRRVSSIMF